MILKLFIFLFKLRAIFVSFLFFSTYLKFQQLVYNRTVYIFYFTVLKDTLEKKGVLGHLKARIRAEVFSALDDDHEPRPSLSHENLLINELIREYLEFNKYKYTASVLIAGKWLFISEENLCFTLFLILRKQPKYVVLLLCHASD